MTYHAIPTVSILVGPDKVSEDTRCKRGVAISDQLTTSPLCAQHADVKAAASSVVTDTLALKALVDGHTVAEAQFKTARTALASGVVTWDGTFDVFVTTVEKYAKTPADVTGTGAVAKGKTINQLAPPTSVDAMYNPKKSWIYIRVHRAPGMDAVDVEYTTDPLTATSAWKAFDANGAIHTLPNPAPGTYWIRAASRTSKGKSDYTTPVSVIVK